MKFPGSKSSAYEVVSALFSEFTPEEIKILDSEDCAVPNMYSLLLDKSKRSELTGSYGIDTFRNIMLTFFSKKEQINDPEFQKDLFNFSLVFYVVEDRDGKGLRNKIGRSYKFTSEDS